MGAAEELAQLFHETYEELAPEHGYETREASRKPWSEVPENNRNLMIAVCSRILDGDSLASLRRDSERLARLEAAGVDNWEGYSNAFREED